MRTSHHRWLGAATACTLLACGGPDITEPGEKVAGNTRAPDAVAMWFSPQQRSTVPAGIMRSEFPGTTQWVPHPGELGDDLEYTAVHFSSAEVGVAVVRDRDGRSGHVLTFDAAGMKWVEAVRIVDPEVTEWLWGQNVPYFQPRLLSARSWPDGSWIVATAVTDLQTWETKLWSVSSATSGVPTWTPLITQSEPLVDPSSRMIHSVVGATSTAQLSVVAVTELNHTPKQAAFLSVDVHSGIPTVSPLSDVTGVVYTSGFKGSDDYFLADVVPAPYDSFEHRITRYCQGAVCSAPGKLEFPAVGGFPFAVLERSMGPVPFVKLGDLSGVEPVVHTVNLPTRSTELEVRSIFPDPAHPDRVRIIAYDSDIEFRPIEWVYEPATGAVTEVLSDRLSDTIDCLFVEDQGMQTWCFDLDSVWGMRQPKSFFFSAVP